MTGLYLPSGTTAREGYDLYVDPDTAAWAYSGLRAFSLGPGDWRTIATGAHEMAVLPLSGGCTVEVESHSFELGGRPGVFEQVTDFAYVPIDSAVKITSEGGGEFALCTALATKRIDPYYVAAADVPVEVRGGGFGTRQINNFLSADQHEADKLIAVEVLTPDGNWSSYPPHKHDEFSEDEVELEEVYYFRIEGDSGIGLFSVYTADREIDETVTVRDDDLFLVPRGYHGPSAAAPGYNMYFLNVMAGPAEERVWKFCDDPDHAWARPALGELPPDSRLPLTTAEGRR